MCLYCLLSAIACIRSSLATSSGFWGERGRSGFRGRGQSSGGEGSGFWGRLGEVRVQEGGKVSGEEGEVRVQEGGKVLGEEGEVGVQGGQGLGLRGRSGF